MKKGGVAARGKTPAMAFILDYLREFPGAGYARVKAACQAKGFGIPAPVVYGNALRLVKKELAPPAEAEATPAATSSRRRSGRPARALADLSGFVAELHHVVAERDRLRRAADEILDVVRSIRGGR